MTVQNISVETLPFLYISGMNVSVASNKIIALAPGQCRDSNDKVDIPFEQPYFINSAIVGLGGLDQGVLAASQNYVVFAIADSSNKRQPGAILSLWSNAYPLLPLGYDSYRLIGFVSTNASTNFNAATVKNAVTSRGFFLQPAISVLSGGNSTGFTAINLGVAIPTTTQPFVIALATVTFIPAAQGDIVEFRPTFSAATTNLPKIVGRQAGIAQTDTIVLHCNENGGQPSVDYRVTSASDSVSVLITGYYSTLA